MIFKKEKVIAGIILIAIGVFMFFKETRIYSWSFYRSASSVPAILIILLMITAVFYVTKKNKMLVYVMAALAAGLLISLILNMRMYFSGSLLSLVLILSPICVGTGLVMDALIRD